MKTVITCLLMAWTVPSLALAAFSDGAKAWDLEIDIDTSLGINFGGLPAGTPVSINMTGPGTAMLSNSTATSADVQLQSMNVSGTITVGPVAGTVTGSIYQPSAGQLSSTTGGFFEAFVRLEANVAGNPFTVYSALPSDTPPGPQANPLYLAAPTVDAIGGGTYTLDASKVPGGKTTWNNNAGGTGVNVFANTEGATWVITPEPTCAALLLAGLPLLRRRR